MAADHTPGPWEVKRQRWSGDPVEVITGEGSLVASLYDVNVARAKATADLIAAAPEMLAALEGVLRVADRTQRVWP